jgi:Tol biopolymer transport system component
LWNFKTQERRNLASIREGNVPAALDYAWSPDGTMIAFVHTETINQLENLFIVNIATGQIVQLTNEFVNHKPVWSADSKTISFVQYYNIANGTYDLYLIDSDGKNLRLAPFQVAGREPAQPTWNPDNKTVAFVGYKAPDGTGSVALDIYVTGVDGVTLQQLTTDGRSYAPEWSPDGKRIAFTISIFDGSLQCNLFIMNSDGTGKRALTTHNNVPIYGMHRWSADGKKIIYGYSPDINTPQSVHVMDVEDLSDKETVAKNVASYDWKPNN